MAIELGSCLIAQNFYGKGNIFAISSSYNQCIKAPFSYMKTGREKNMVLVPDRCERLHSCSVLRLQSCQFNKQDKQQC